MKKVLVVSGSPRKGGNSDTLCDQFIKGAQEAGHQVEKIFLGEKNIHYCTGCGVCNQTHACVLQDDMAPLLEKMLTAEVIVLASPVYFYTIDGQMKTFIDRCVPRYTEMSGKDFYYIVTAADPNHESMDKALDCFRGFVTDCLEDGREKGIVYGTGAWQVGEIKKLAAMQEAYELGRKC